MYAFIPFQENVNLPDIFKCSLKKQILFIWYILLFDHVKEKMNCTKAEL